MEPLDTHDLPELARARAWWAQQQWDQAEAEFVRLAAAHPNNWHALIDAARVLGDRQEIGRSTALLDRLRALGGGRDELILPVAQTYRMSRREDEAMAMLEPYVLRGRGRRDAAAQMELAVLYERHHRLDDAEAAA